MHLEEHAYLMVSEWNSWGHRLLINIRIDTVDPFKNFNNFSITFNK